MQERLYSGRITMYDDDKLLSRERNPMIFKCLLCGQEINHYHELSNRFVVDESRSVDIYSECIQKFIKWQQKKYAALFPTKAAKRYLKKQE